MTSSKKMLITGGSSGIGSALVHGFARAGYQVWFTYWQGRERALALCDELEGFQVTALQLNQGDAQSVQDCLQNLPDDLHGLVVNAGLGSKTVESVASDYYEQDEQFMQVNALGALWLCRQLIPEMEKRGRGKVLLISSVGGGIAPFPRFRFAEQMSKAALAYMGRQYAVVLANTGVDIFTVCPGAVDTPMFQSSTLASLDRNERQRFLASLPGGRLITAEEIASLCLFLCSDAGQILRGAVLGASLGLGSAPGLICSHE